MLFAYFIFSSTFIDDTKLKEQERGSGGGRKDKRIYIVRRFVENATDRIVRYCANNKALEAIQTKSWSWW